MTDSNIKTVRITEETLRRVKRIAIAESSTDGDFVSIGETVQRMCDFWEQQKNLGKTTE